MYQGVGMLSFNSYSLINIRFLINKGGVIMSHQDKKSLIGQADDRLQKMTQAGVGRSKHQDKILPVHKSWMWLHCLNYTVGGMAEDRSLLKMLRQIHAAGQILNAAEVMPSGINILAGEIMRI